MNNKVKSLVKIALVSVIYIVLTLALDFMSFGPIQVRISEILLFFVLFDSKYAYSLILGTAVANCFSSIGIFDAIFGTIATALVVLLLLLVKKPWFLLISAPLINGIVVASELYLIMELPFILSLIEVFVGELIAVSVGLFVYYMLKKNSKFVELAKL